MTASVYLDCNATAPIRPEAAKAAADALMISGNPTSVHARGRAARAAIEDARAAVAAIVGADPEAVIFTSGGTEANGLAILSAAKAGKVKRLIVGATEHASVAESAKASGLPVEIFPVDRNGVADLAWLRARLDRWTEADGQPFVALVLANNETGVIQPTAEVGRIVHAAGGLLHLDAVQAVGKIPVDFDALGADTLALSAHKLGGPAGAGALVFATSAAIHRQIHGGDHEWGLRAGTENLTGIAGFGAAALAALRDLPHAGEQAIWRDAVAARLKAAGATIAGEAAPRLPNTLCLAVADWPSTLQVIALDLDGVMISGGSACSSGKVKQSGVLAAMGLHDVAGGSARVSGGWTTTDADWNRFADVWIANYGKHLSRIAAKAVA